MEKEQVVILIEDAKQAWRWLSMQIPAFNATFLLVWASLPQKFQDALPLPWVIGIAVVLLVAGMVGRLVKQGDK
jgi:hypothetical protein